MSVSIVMPSYNEEAVIELVVSSYYQEVVVKHEDWEMIVVDDCSKDRTYAVLQELCCKFPRLKVYRTPVNGGHGKAVRLAYELASKEYVFQTDSDNQFDHKDFWRLYAYKDTCDVVTGIRQDRHDVPLRILLTRILRLLNFCVFGVWIKDVNCPFRLLRRQVLLELLRHVPKDALAPNIMISILAKKQTRRFQEVVVTHYERKTGQVSLLNFNLFKFAFNTACQLWALRRRPRQV